MVKTAVVEPVRNLLVLERGCAKVIQINSLICRVQSQNLCGTLFLFLCASRECCGFSPVQVKSVPTPPLRVMGTDVDPGYPQSADALAIRLHQGDDHPTIGVYICTRVGMSPLGFKVACWLFNHIVCFTPKSTTEREDTGGKVAPLLQSGFQVFFVFYFSAPRRNFDGSLCAYEDTPVLTDIMSWMLPVPFY